MTVQMADAAASFENSLHALTASAELGLSMIFRALQFTCIRNLDELPDLVLQPVWNGTIDTASGSVCFQSHH